MRSNPTHAVVLLALSASVLIDGPIARADTIIPVDQDRFTSVQVDTDCEGLTSDGEAARGFKPFESAVETVQDCPEISIFASAYASQISEIGGSSMSATANAVFYARSPGSVFVRAVSDFSVTFELPRPSTLEFNGLVLGDGQVPGVETKIELTGPGGETIFLHSLTGPFPLGEPTKEFIDETRALEAGVYTLRARALGAEAVDMADDAIAGESALYFTANVSLLGDLNGDEEVSLADLLLLLQDWGPCELPCPPSCLGDLDQDCEVSFTDLLLLLQNWG